MIARAWGPACVAVELAVCMAMLASNSSYAQVPSSSTNTDAPLIVDGIVRQIFTSDGQRRNDHLVEIEVRRSEARKSAPGSTRSRFPAPAESVYVHVSERPEAGGRLGSGDGKKRIPDEGDSIRAYLKPRAAGGWQDALPNWFESNNEVGDSVAGEDRTAKPESQTVLGMTIESMRIENRTAFRVASVARGGPAQGAGLEVGDVIAGVNGAELVKVDELTALAALGEKFALMVIDVNSGRVARIEIDPAMKPTDAPATGPAPPPPGPQAVSLGVSAEVVTLGARSALKVIRVDPAGIAAKAGLEAGDIVVAANGVPITSVEHLLSALRKSGPTLKLTVRDSRTGRDTDLALNLGPEKPAPSKESESPVTRPPGKLGAITELAFHDNNFAVKVTEVTPGSAAALAGLRPGVIIIAANGKPVLHPDDLNDLVRKGQGTLKLTVVDPASGAKSNVDVNVGR